MESSGLTLHTPVPPVQGEESEQTSLGMGFLVVEAALLLTLLL